MRPTPSPSLPAVTTPARVPPSRATAPAGAPVPEPAAPSDTPSDAPSEAPSADPSTGVAAKNDGGATLVYGSAPRIAPTPSRNIAAQATRIARSTSRVSTPAP